MSPTQDIKGRPWQSLLWFNIYRLAIATLLFSSSKLLDPFPFGSFPQIFAQLAAAYFLFGLFSYGLLIKSKIPIDAILTILITGDTFFIGLLLYLAGGSSSGLSLLLIPALVGVGLIGRGRLALFHAAIATLGLLIADALHSLRAEATPSDLARVGLIGIGYFATAWLAHYFGRLTRLSEALAHQRGVDLANLQEVNAAIVQAMALGVLVVDGKGVIQTQNAQAKHLLGLIEITGPKVHQIPESAVSLARLGRVNKLPWFTKPALSEVAPSIAEKWQVWQSSENVSSTAVAILKLSTTDKSLRIRFTPISSQRNTGALIFIEDLAEVEAQAQQLKLVALGRLTANIAHEIRNPLGAVSHATELLLEGHAEQQQRLLQIIANNVQRIDRIVQEAMQLARRDRAQPEVFLLKATLATLLEEIRAAERIPAEAIVLTGTDGLSCSFDLGHFSQIIWNLVRNAWQHSQQRTGSLQITLTIEPRSQQIACSIFDDGPGVPREQQVQLFEPFFTTRTGGTGLGLYLAKELAEANGGNLAYIPSPRQGACFRLLVPTHRG